MRASGLADYVTPEVQHLPGRLGARAALVISISVPSFGLRIAAPFYGVDRRDQRKPGRLNQSTHDIREARTRPAPGSRSPVPFAPSRWKFGAQDIEALDYRRHRKQGRRLGHQRFGDRSIEMVLPSGFIGKRIKYGERGWRQSQREPHRCGRLLIREFETLLQECDELLFLTGAGLETNK
jgi:hypothetical protein